MDFDSEVMEASIADFPHMVASDDQQAEFGDEHVWDERKDRLLGRLMDGEQV